MPITELAYYLFIFTIPVQLKLIIDPESAYLDNYFIQPLALFIYLSDLLFVAFILTWLWAHKGKIAPKNTLFWAILPVFWAIFNLFHVEHTSLWLYGTIKFAQFWLLFLYVKQNPKVSRGTMVLIAFWALFEGFVAIFQYYLQHNTGLHVLGEYLPGAYETGSATLNTVSGKILRPYGTFPHPNVLAGFLTVGLAFWLYVSRETKSLRKNIIVSCGTIIYIWAIIISFSRSAWLALGFTLLMYFAWLVKQRLYLKTWISAILIIVSCGTILITNKTMLFPRIVDSGETSQAQTTREQFNSRAWNYFKQHPITGYGSKQYIKIASETVDQPWMNQPPHNIFLYYLVEFGLIGFIIGFWSLYKLGFTWNNWDLLGFTIFGIIIILGIFDHYLLSTQQTYLLFAILLAFLTNKKDVSQLCETSK